VLRVQNFFLQNNPDDFTHAKSYLVSFKKRKNFYNQKDPISLKHDILVSYFYFIVHREYFDKQFFAFVIQAIKLCIVISKKTAIDFCKALSY